MTLSGQNVVVFFNINFYSRIRLKKKFVDSNFPFFHLA